MVLRSAEHLTAATERILQTVADVNGNGTVGSPWITEGVVITGHFGHSHWAPDYNNYPRDLVDMGDDDGYGLSPYGVCDNHEQILARCPTLTEPGREFFIQLTPVLKANQHPSGGWRWHKWGPYIGVHEPTCEYLYDEPVIEQVYCYQIYELEA